MDDHTGSLGDHRRQQRSIETDRRHQVLVELVLPLIVAQRGEPAAGRARAAQHIDDDVDAAQPPPDLAGDGGAAVGRREIGGDVTGTVTGAVPPVGNRAGRRQHRRAGAGQGLHDGGADAFGAAGHQRPATAEFKVEAHE